MPVVDKAELAKELMMVRVVKVERKAVLVGVCRLSDMLTVFTVY